MCGPVNWSIDVAKLDFPLIIAIFIVRSNYKLSKATIYYRPLYFLEESILFNQTLLLHVDQDCQIQGDWRKFRCLIHTCIAHSETLNINSHFG